MRAIFISYRRGDSEGEAGRLFADLVSHFGETSVFMDVTAIQVGRDFRKAIDESVATCGVLLAIIGRNWVDAKNEIGERRLDDKSDFVRLETAAALKRDILVIPVLVQGAKIPRPDQLPDDLRDLAFRNGCELTHARWNSDLQLLVRALRAQLEAQKSPGPVQPAPSPASRWKSRSVILAIAVSAVATIVLAIYAFFPPLNTTVPDLTGSSLSDAAARLDAAHLVMGRRTRQKDAARASDTVLSQSPPPNAPAKNGTAVDLVIAEKPAMVEVPPLRGMPLDAAKQALGAQGLVVGGILREVNSDVARNSVLRASPSSGKTAIGTAVDLVVSDLPTARPPPSPAEGAKIEVATRPPTKPLIFQGKPKGVSFDHTPHINALGGKCTPCHDADGKGLFPQKFDQAALKFKGGAMHRTAVDAKTSCGMCHHPDPDVNGAFEVKGHCTKCHNVVPPL